MVYTNCMNTFKAPALETTGAVQGGTITTLERTKQLLVEENHRLQQLGICKTGIFGSVVCGDDILESDVDILIELNSDHNLTLISLVELEQVFSERLNKKVELVIGSNLKPQMKEKILKEVIYVEA